MIVMAQANIEERNNMRMAQTNHCTSFVKKIAKIIAFTEGHFEYLYGNLRTLVDMFGEVHGAKTSSA